MLRLGFVVGLLFICGSVLLLLVALLTEPERTILGDAFDAIICKSDEELVRELGPKQYDSRGEYRSLAYHCLSAAGEERDVTLSVILSAVGGFVVVLLGGIAIVSATARRMVRRRTTQFMGQVWTQAGYPPPEQEQPPLPPEVAEILAGVFGRQQIDANQAAALTGITEERDLAESLEQLERARNQSLISDEEYDKLRREVLRKFKD